MPEVNLIFILILVFIGLVVLFYKTNINIKTTKEMGGQIMSTLQDVKDAIAQEKQEVTDKLAEVNATIEELKKQIADGTAVTPEQFDELKAGINNIFIKDA